VACCSNTTRRDRVFANPANIFVAGLRSGSPAMNLLPARVVANGTGASLQGDG